MTKVKEVAAYLENFAPLAYQENYDNSGLIVGDSNIEITSILVCLDTTEAVIDEAIKTNCNLVISHHPIIFKGLKRLTGKNYVERTILKAIRNNIAIYAIHTNLDNVFGGVNSRICEKLGLVNTNILVPKTGVLSKLVTFIPLENREAVMAALYELGVGEIGKYDHCSFTIEGIGTFRPSDDARPHIGKTGNDESAVEARVEVIFPTHKWSAVKAALIQAHPYEEVAHYYTSLNNTDQEVGSGMIGELPKKMEPTEFLSYLKEKMDLNVIRHTNLPNHPIKKIALCGGSGSFLIQDAMRKGADVFITGDVKYHEFFDADGNMMIADIGHYESEVFTKDLLHDLLIKKFNTFAVNLSKLVTNPISYY